MRKTFNLESDYGLNSRQSMAQLKDIGTLSENTAKYDSAYARVKQGLGWTDDKFQTLSAFDAAWMDANWKGIGGGQTSATYLNSQNHVIVPAGTYYQTVIGEFNSGHYIGQGASYTDVNNDSVNTKLAIWHEKWNGDIGERSCLQSSTWGRPGNFAYVEGTRIEGFGLEGRSREFASQTFSSSGIRMWKPGEVTYTTNIYAKNFREYGIEIFGATPHTIGDISCFDNTRAGIGLKGSWGATLNIGTISCDDNAAIIESIPGYDNEAGGTINISTIKLETGVAAEVRNPWRGQIVARIFGQFALNIGTISAAATFVRTDALFVADARLTTGALQQSYINVGAMKGFNYATIVQDIMNQKRWPSRGNFASYGFNWTSAGNGVLKINGDLQTSQPCPCPDRLGFLRTSTEQFDYQNYTPKYFYIIDGSTTAPPPAPTITSVSVVASTTTVNEGGSVNLTATVAGTGAFDPSVTWSIVSGPGSLTVINGSATVFVSPQVSTDVTTIIRATSVADPTKSAQVSVVVKNVETPATISSVTISPASGQVNELAQISLTAAVQGTGTFNSNVTWTIVSGGGTLSSTSTNTTNYTAPSVSANSTAIIMATSVGDATKSTTVTLSVINVVTPPTITSVAVTGPATLNENARGTFEAVVAGTGSFNPNVTWTIVSGGGTLSSPSSNITNYTAPEVAANSTAVIRATSVGDTTKVRDVTISVINVVTPAPTTENQIDPKEMGVVINEDDPTSLEIAQEYIARWGVPSANVARVRLGNQPDNANTSQINTARQAIASAMPSTVQKLALCWMTPSRSGSNSITWAITMGVSSISTSGALPNNPAYNYTGKRPFTDLGIRPSALVLSKALVNKGRTSHGKKPAGTSYMKAANDQSGAPRGKARMTQMSSLNNSTQYPNISFSYEDMVTTNGPSGEGPSNNILNKTKMLMYWNGMYKIYGMETNQILDGAVGDYVTSTSGNLPTGLGQTPITYMIENGFVGTMGTVVEPWQGSPGAGASSGGLVEQFTDITRFVPLYQQGFSLIDAYWRSLRWPVRALVVCDPLCAPYGSDSGTGTAPIYGCTDPAATNYNPNATVNDGSCIFNPTNPEVLAKYSFGSNSTPAKLVADTGVDLTQTLVWRQAKISNGTLVIDQYNASYSMNLQSVKRIKYVNVTLRDNNHTWLNNILRIRSNGEIFNGINNQVLKTGVQINVLMPELIIEFPTPVTITTLIGKAPSSDNAPTYMTVDSIEFLK